MHLGHVLTAAQGQDCSQVVSWTLEPFLKLPQLRHTAQEQACVKILQPSMLDKDWYQELEAFDPKYTTIYVFCKGQYLHRSSSTNNTL